MARRAFSGGSMATLDNWRTFLETPQTIELVRAELVVRDGSPLFVGSGEIGMGSLQDVSYTVTPSAGDEIAFLQIIEHKDQNYYDGTSRLRLFGEDANGIRWSGGWTMPHEFTSGPLVVKGRLTALNVAEKLTTETQSTELLFRADYLHPLARVMGVLGGPRKILFEKRLEVLGSVIDFTYERKSNVVSITASHSKQLPPTYNPEKWLTEPLRIMFGQPVQPRLVARNRGHQAGVWILVPPRLDVSSWSAYWADDSNPDGFFNCYASLLTMIAQAGDLSGEPHSVTRFYDELAQIAHASRWVMALALAGCTEGLAKLLRPKMTSGLFEEEKQWSKAADDLASSIEKLNGLDALKKRAVDAVRQTKGPSTAGTLRELQKLGAVSPEQFKAWSDLRHRVMHGQFVSAYSNEVEDNQMSHLMGMVRALTLELVKRV
jgi:hypothetical protein